MGLRGRVIPDKDRRAGCTKLPSFNFPGQTPASRCGTHREEGMVNVRHRVCQHEGCGTEAKYNLPGEAHGAFCGQHKLKDMERVNTRRCNAEACDKRASFNHPGDSDILHPPFQIYSRAPA